ncbi:hypothetical protein [Pseudaquabacterium pictum]|uniref:Uncharacterized protein n=1 Tax=Pseudaquabacterium pictum TaxID=2315236 RepID=A0A480AIJ0_9BURK|nr:hypothetical protein [Rubrivivax pictus]GCL61454.1 hypothetical protein AQPW35_05350 [Rubrivivax pictus]
MGRSTERAQDSQLSVWTFEAAEQAPAPSTGWLASLTAWPRWPVAPKPRRPDPQLRADPAVAEATTLPEAGRGQALRLAHRALRDRMRAQRALRRVLPHLYYIERALSRQGSAALLDMPVWVLQRGLQQLSRLPADNLGERVQFSVLQQRLVEAIQQRSAPPAQRPPKQESPDSFMGGLDSQIGGRSTTHSGHGGLEVTELPDSAYDDLVQGSLPAQDGAANTSGWYRS